MTEARGSNYVRCAGSLAEGRGEIAWRLGDRGGGVVLSEDEVTVIAEPSGPGGESSKGWAFESSWDADPLEGAAVFRHVAVEASEGATIVVSSTGPTGIEGHGLERTEGSCRRAVSRPRSRRLSSRPSTTCKDARLASDSSSGAARTHPRRESPHRCSEAPRPTGPGPASFAAELTASRDWVAICSGAHERARSDHHGDLGLRRRAHHSARPVVRRGSGRDRDPVRGARQGDGGDRARRRQASALRAREGPADRGGVPRQARRRARARARASARAAPLPGDLLRRPASEPADDRPDARGQGPRAPDGAAHQQRPGVGAAVAFDAPGRRDLRARGRLRLRRLPEARP